MWYENSEGCFYIDELERVWSVRENGGSDQMPYYPETVAQRSRRIDKPQHKWADDFLRSLDEALA